MPAAPAVAAAARPLALSISRRKLGNISAQPTASGTTIVTLPRGVAYRRICLKLEDAGGVRTEAEIKADASRVQVKVESRSKIDVSPTELIAVRSYHGDQLGVTQTDTSGLLIIDLCPFWFLNPVLADACELGTADLAQDVTVEIDWTAGTGATKLAGWTEVNLNNHASGMVYCLRGANKAFGTTGDDADIGIDLSRKDVSILANHYSVNGGAGVASHISQSVNSIPTIDGMTVGAWHELLKMAQKTPVTGYVHADHVNRNLLADRLSIGGRRYDALADNEELTAFSNTITWSTAPTSYRIIRETLEPARAAY